MLQSLFRRAEASVDHAIASVLARALVAIPFLVGAGFGTAALAIYVYEAFGKVVGNLLLAGVFCLAGLVTAAIVATRSNSSSRGGPETAPEASSATDGAEASRPLFDPMDRDVMAAMATTVGPVALPFVLRSVMRNLPLIAAVAAAGFVLTRNSNGEATDGETPMQPAE